MYLRFFCANATKFFTSLASLTSHVVPCRVKNWMSWKGKCCNTRRVGHTRSYRQEKFFIIPIEIYIQSIFYSFSRKTVGFLIQCQENKEERRIMQCHFLGWVKISQENKWTFDVQKLTKMRRRYPHMLLPWFQFQTIKSRFHAFNCNWIFQ